MTNRSIEFHFEVRSANSDAANPLVECDLVYNEMDNGAERRTNRFNLLTRGAQAVLLCVQTLLLRA
jgi:hypothetical protein